MFPLPPLSFVSKEVISVVRAVPLCFTAFSLSWGKKNLCSLWCVFLFWLQCTLTFWGLSLLRDVLECYRFNNFSFLYFKLYFLFWQRIHLKSWCRKGLFTIIHSGYLICNKFMVLWLTLHFPEGRRCISAVSRSKEPFRVCSQHVPPCRPDEARPAKA